MIFGIEAEALRAFLAIIWIDLVLAGDNAIVIGLAAAGLAPDLRKKAILIGILGATVLRIIFALATTWLMQYIWLVLLGGILLLWVCWKMYRELTTSHDENQQAEEALAGADLNADGTIGSKPGTKTLRQAVVQIIIADVSMSLDNVLAVAGTAGDHTWALVFGLVLSVVLMGVGSTFIAKLLNRFKWIAWVGLLIILYVAIHMIYMGSDRMLDCTLPEVPFLSESRDACSAAVKLGAPTPVTNTN